MEAGASRSCSSGSQALNRHGRRLHAASTRRLQAPAPAPARPNPGGERSGNAVPLADLGASLWAARALPTTAVRLSKAPTPPGAPHGASRGAEPMGALPGPTLLQRRSLPGDGRRPGGRPGVPASCLMGAGNLWPQAPPWPSWSASRGSRPHGGSLLGTPTTLDTDDADAAIQGPQCPGPWAWHSPQAEPPTPPPQPPSSWHFLRTPSGAGLRARKPGAPS